MLTSLVPYYGGKSLKSATGVGRWVHSLLPKDTERVTWCEPFCGMASMTLARGKSDHEILNDISRVVYCFFYVLRANPKQLYEMLSVTPHSEAVFWEAVECIKKFMEGERTRFDRAPIEDTLRVAWAFVTCAEQSFSGTFIGSTDGRMPSWSTRYRPYGGNRVGQRGMDNVLRLAQRLDDVQFFCRDGVDVLDSLRPHDSVIAYVDPPYRQADTNSYVAVPDYDRLVSVLLGMRGRVAVSGYPGDYPALSDSKDWIEHRFETHVNIRSDQMQARIECLWTNYEPDKYQPDLFTQSEEETDEKDS